MQAQGAPNTRIQRTRFARPSASLACRCCVPLGGKNLDDLVTDLLVILKFEMTSNMGSTTDEPMRVRRGGRGFCATLLALIGIALVYAAPRLFRAAGSLSTQAQMQEAVEQVVAGPPIQQVAISGVYMSGVKLPNQPFHISVDMIGVDVDVYGRGWSDAMRDEAIAQMEMLTAGKSITIEFDLVRTQQSGNWPHVVAWIWADDILLNAEMVRRGYVFVGEFGTNVKYRDAMVEAEREAMESKNGRWAATPAPQEQ